MRLVHIPDLDDLDRDVVAHLSFFSQGNKAFACLAGMILDEAIENFVVQQVSVEPIRAVQDEIIFLQGDIGDIVMTHRFITDAPGQSRSVGAGHGLAFEQQP